MGFAETFTKGLVDALSGIAESNGASFNPSVSRHDERNLQGGTPPHIRVWQSQENLSMSEGHGGYRVALAITGFVTVYQDPSDPITTTDELVSLAKHDVTRAITDYVLSVDAESVELDGSFQLDFVPNWELDREETEPGFQFELQVAYGLSAPDLELVNPF